MSRITERFNTRGTRQNKILTESFSGPTSYATGGNVYNSTIFRQLERATALNVTGGYASEVATGSVSGNAFKLKIYAVSGVSTGAAEIPNATNLIAATATVLLEGF